MVRLKVRLKALIGRDGNLVRMKIRPKDLIGRDGSHRINRISQAERVSRRQEIGSSNQITLAGHTSWTDQSDPSVGLSYGPDFRPDQSDPSVGLSYGPSFRPDQSDTSVDFHADQISV